MKRCACSAQIGAARFMSSLRLRWANPAHAVSAGGRYCYLSRLLALLTVNITC